MKQVLLYLVSTSIQFVDVKQIDLCKNLINLSCSTIETIPYVCCLGPPRISPLQPQFHAELGREFQINCTATNIPNASVNLIFSWSGPNGVRLDYTTTDEDDSRTATSTLHINTITHDHGGVYQCIVRNGGSANDTTSSEMVVQGTHYQI